MRGETAFRPSMLTSAEISIHSPHARGDTAKSVRTVSDKNFNPLPSCEGRPVSDNRSNRQAKFQSTPLMRGETSLSFRQLCVIRISIHSPHARGDKQVRACLFHLIHFNPLPSCEGRRYGGRVARGNKYFNPLPSCEGRRWSDCHSLERY